MARRGVLRATLMALALTAASAWSPMRSALCATRQLQVSVCAGVAARLRLPVQPLRHRLVLARAHVLLRPGLAALLVLARREVGLAAQDRGAHGRLSGEPNEMMN